MLTLIELFHVCQAVILFSVAVTAQPRQKQVAPREQKMVAAEAAILKSFEPAITFFP
jgi:type II secretory pathway component PulM